MEGFNFLIIEFLFNLSFRVFIAERRFKIGNTGICDLKTSRFPEFLENLGEFIIVEISLACLGVILPL